MTFNTKDLLAGGVFIALGLSFALSAYFYVELGNSVRMGPGYFPLMAACVLMLLGVLIAMRSIGAQPSPITRVPWRGLVLVLGSTIIFGMTVRSLGFVPAVALIALLSAFASQRMTPLLAATIMAGVTLFCVGVFHYGLGLPLKLFGPWLGG